MTIKDVVEEIAKTDGPVPKSLFDHSHDHARALIVMALKKSKGSIHLAANALGVSRITIWRRMKKYGIDANPSATAKP